MPRTARRRGRGALLAGLHWFQTWRLLASTDGSSPKSRSQVSVNVERLLSDSDFSKLWAAHAAEQAPASLCPCSLTEWKTNSLFERRGSKTACSKL